MSDLKEVMFSKDGEQSLLDTKALFSVKHAFIDGNLGTAELNNAEKIKFIFCKGSNSWRKFVEFTDIDSIPVIKYTKDDIIYLLDFEVSMKIGTAEDKVLMENCLHEFIRKEKISS
jgi:hypothetical protein